MGGLRLNIGIGMHFNDLDLFGCRFCVFNFWQIICSFPLVPFILSVCVPVCIVYSIHMRIIISRCQV